jgi:hypothetical protein
MGGPAPFFFPPDIGLRIRLQPASLPKGSFYA